MAHINMDMVIFLSLPDMQAGCACDTYYLFSSLRHNPTCAFRAFVPSSVAYAPLVGI
jgi:hypothetical protein